MKYRAAVITVSDSAYQKVRTDLSGPAVSDALTAAEFLVSVKNTVPDEKDRIAAAILEAAELAQLVVTTGGTGIAARDVTPEATLSVCERVVPGLAELMRSEGAEHNKMAPLSRGVCAVRGRTLILNVPGNPQGAVESLKAVLHLLPHALELLSGNTSH
jgi:molybdopterin adenylyltransferase